MRKNQCNFNKVLYFNSLTLPLAKKTPELYQLGV